MTSPEPVSEDGSLPDAKRRLEDAVSGLVDPVSEVVDDRHVWVDSYYVQLVEAVPGEKQHRSGVAASQAPLWVDAVDLKSEIDTAVSVWLPAPMIDLLDGDATPLTVLRLQQLESKGWRPQDTKQMDQISGIVESWAAGIKKLLSPIPKWTLPSPCPECTKATVYRKDSSGDMIRQPALQIGPDGCTCLACRTVWPPDRFVFLSRVLGSLPANVDAA